MLSLWQAHLSFILLSFVLLGSLRLTAPWRPWLLPVLALVSFVPINGLSLAAYVRSVTDDLAISTLVLLYIIAAIFNLRIPRTDAPLQPLSMNAVELVRPLFMDQWPAIAFQHVAVLVVYAVVGFWVALALTRKRFAG